MRHKCQLQNIHLEEITHGFDGQRNNLGRNHGVINVKIEIKRLKKSSKK